MTASISVYIELVFFKMFLQWNYMESNLNINYFLKKNQLM